MNDQASQVGQRWAIAIHGVVQGMGFRPFVRKLAMELKLVGFVRNTAQGLHIEAQGPPEELGRFIERLSQEAPAMAQIRSVSHHPCTPIAATTFEIQESDSGGVPRVLVPADVATCDECLKELFDPSDRRFGYPFINCTNCGPRLTIIEAMPYDRPRTTMAGFAMCPRCQAEYDDVNDRRCHAQPNACPVCGPRLRLIGAEGDPLATALEVLRRGGIVAVKGLGGFHLACDASDEAAVLRLRQRKHRDERPFAVMEADVAAAREVCVMSAEEERALTSTARPIVLARRRDGIDLAPVVAPGSRTVGVMLPYTPVHHLLLRGFGRGLVMTSGNRSDEPMVTEDDGAVERLRDIADVIITHDRPIAVRCDDSVVRVVAGEVLPMRRSRGEAPRPVAMPVACSSPMLALGGQLKATFALGQGDEAILSHHLGDLDHLEAYRAYVDSIDHYRKLFQIEPVVVIHDLHPDYASTRYAMERWRHVRMIAVQHHHAHMASCMAENGLNERVIGVSFDGTGYGLDGAVWGGEFLLGDFRGFERVGHLRYVGMPGGEQAIHQPWRMALSHLCDAGMDHDGLLAGVTAGERRVVGQMLARGLNSPKTSSVGRLFDAVSALADVRQVVSYEGQAAVLLEELTRESDADDAYSCGVEGIEIDTRPMIREVVADVRRGVPASQIARRLHLTLAGLIVSMCRRIRDATGVNAVTLSGGVFVNAVLLEKSIAGLKDAGMRVYRHRQVPPNDGGLCLGQLAIAAAMMQRS